MEKQVLTEEYYGHHLEVTIIETIPEIKLEFIPDSVKKMVFEHLECNGKDGEFSHDDTGDFILEEFPNVTVSGSWRIIESPEVMERIVSSYFFYMWNRWCERECEKVFGWLHNHLWEKWCYFCNDSSRGAAEKFYAELTKNTRQLIVNRANEVFNGSEEKL